MNELTKLEAKLSDRVRQTIESVFDELGEELAYYRVQLRILKLGYDYMPLSNWNVLYDNHSGYCSFCGEETYYYDEDNACMVCASCLKELKQSKQPSSISTITVDKKGKVGIGTVGTVKVKKK